MLLQVITVSTRQGRQGHAVATWFTDFARQHSQFEIEPVDLAEVALPLFDEARHPRLGQYEHEHTKAWSAIVNRADAFVFVTPEYNYSTPPSLINALDYLFQEWAFKPAGFVSYGGMSGGLRSVQTAKLTLTSLRVMPIPEGVALPMFNQHISKETGVFDPGSQFDQAGIAMLTALHRWAEALKTLRVTASA